MTLLSPTSQDYSIIVETMDSPYITIGTPQEVTFRLGQGFPPKPVHVWKSSAQEQFVEVATIQPKDGILRYKFDSEAIYTLTTTTGQRKGGSELRIPPSAQMPLPYEDRFEVRPEHALPKHFIDQSGVFEIVSRPDGNGGCLRQVVPSKGIEWHYHGNPEPYTVTGDERWTDYQVQVDVLPDGPGGAAIYARVTNVGTKAEPPAGYWVKVEANGDWQLKKKSDTLQSGHTALSAGHWYKLGIRVSGNRIAALINGTEVGQARDDSYDHGLAGVGCDWHRSWFDNFLVTRIGGKD